MLDLISVGLEKGSQASMMAVAVYLLVLERRFFGMHERLRELERVIMRRQL